VLAASSNAASTYGHVALSVTARPTLIMDRSPKTELSSHHVR
jgi:hypothetical protein